MQSISALRTGSYVIKDGTDFFIVSIYITSELIARRYILFFEDAKNPEKVSTRSGRFWKYIYI